MKKIIAAIIRAIMPKAIKEHEKEEKARRIHNAVIMQNLLDNEHDLRDRINEHFDTAYTTEKALRIARISGMTNYSSFRELQEADFR